MHNPHGQATTNAVDKIPFPSNKAPLTTSMEKELLAVPDRNEVVASPVLPRRWDKLLWSLHHIFAVVMQRSQDMVPEYTERKSSAAMTNPWGVFPFLALGDACGLLIIAHAFAISRKGESGFEAFLLFGFCLMFLPTIIRLILPQPSRLERIGLLCTLCVSCYLVKAMTGPLYFTYFDEFLHWRTAEDILLSGHLFSSNELLPVSPYYPGLEIITNALSTLGGLDTFQAGMLVVGVAHVLMILTFFLLNEQILLSPRAASIAAIIYTANPHFLIFDAQYGYESLALPLMTFMLFTLVPHQPVSVRLKLLQLQPAIRLKRLQLQPSFTWLTGGNRRELGNDLHWITITASLTAGAIAMTHHATSLFLVGILLCWTLIYASMRLTPIWQSRLLKVTLFTILAVIGISVFSGNPVEQYFITFFSQALSELTYIMAGGGMRQLFVSYTGQPTPIWERILSVSSVLIVLGCLPFGLLHLQQRYRANALTVSFGFIALLYPLSQIFRFTNSGAELTDRIAAFIFLPISVILAIFIVQACPMPRLNQLRVALMTVAILIVCLGGIIVGTGPTFDQMPGPYAVTADSRSIEQEGIQAARWAREHLGVGHRVATDRINQILMGTYGDQSVVTSIQDHVDVSPVFLSPSLSDDALWILRSTRTRYLVVDLRLSQHLPLLGYYYEATEDGAFHHSTPASAKALTKFATMPQVNKVFDSGDIVIYDVGGLINVLEKS